jgi:hypothetical protein
MMHQQKESTNETEQNMMHQQKESTNETEQNMMHQKPDMNIKEIKVKMNEALKTSKDIIEGKNKQQEIKSIPTLGKYVISNDIMVMEDGMVIMKRSGATYIMHGENTTVIDKDRKMKNSNK